MNDKEKINTYIKDKKGYKYLYFLKSPIMAAYEEKSILNQQTMQNRSKYQRFNSDLTVRSQILTVHYLFSLLLKDY